MPKGYAPKDGLHVTLLTQRKADEHARRVHRVPDDCGLGWKPYTILITDRAVSTKAFHRMSDFRRWLGRDFKVSLSGAWHSPGIRSGRIVAR